MASWHQFHSDVCFSQLRFLFEEPSSLRKSLIWGSHWSLNAFGQNPTLKSCKIVPWDDLTNKKLVNKPCTPRVAHCLRLPAIWAMSLACTFNSAEEWTIRTWNTYFKLVTETHGATGDWVKLLGARHMLRSELWTRALLMHVLDQGCRVFLWILVLTFNTAYSALHFHSEQQAVH
jgi:hypothetical protein